MDHWHVVRLANEMVTKVRRRRVWETHQRRGRNIDTPWKYRKLLTCAGDRLSVRQRARLTEILQQDIELAVAWGIKEHVRQLLAARDTASFQREWARLEHAVKATRLPEPAAPVQDPHRVAQGAADLLPHEGHERSHRGSEPDREDLQADREGLPQPRQLPMPHHWLRADRSRREHPDHAQS